MNAGYNIFLDTFSKTCTKTNIIVGFCLTVLGVGSHVMVRVVTLTFKLQYSYPNINMKVNCKQKEVKLTASKIGTHVMVSIVTKYGK